MTTNIQRSGRWGRWVVSLAGLVLVVLAMQWWQTRNFASGTAPPLAGQLLSGESVALDDLRGQPVLVHFWATWCPVCRFEESSIASLSRSHRVLTVAINSGGADELRAYLQRQALDFPVLPDPAGDLARPWGVSGVPASFMVDATGSIAYATVGYTSGIGLRARMWLAGI